MIFYVNPEIKKKYENFHKLILTPAYNHISLQGKIFVCQCFYHHYIKIQTWKFIYLDWADFMAHDLPSTNIQKKVVIYEYCNSITSTKHKNGVSPLPYNNCKLNSYMKKSNKCIETFLLFSIEYLFFCITTKHPLHQLLHLYMI